MQNELSRAAFSQYSPTAWMLGGFRDMWTYLLTDGLLAAVCHLLKPFGKLHLWKKKVGSEKTCKTPGFPW